MAPAGRSGKNEVRWLGTPDSWRDIVELYDGLETVAFWQTDDTLDVETKRGRETIPVGSSIVRLPDGTIEVSSH